MLKLSLSEEMLTELMEIATTSEKILKVLKAKMVNTALISDLPRSELKRKRILISVSKKTLKPKITPTKT
jgi:hypothetical protein